MREARWWGAVFVAAVGCGDPGDVADRLGGDAEAPDASLGASLDASLDALPDATDAGAADAPPPPPSPAMGATVVPGAVDFRVWAPAALGVDVVGSFPAGTAPLASVGDGVFHARVPGAKAGDRYHFVLATKAGPLSRLDPAAREVAEGGADCVVVDPTTYAWTTAPYAPRRREETVIYELHVGSFACPTGPTSCTFDAVRARLPWLADLGVTAVELMPVNAHGSDRGWGYNPQLYQAPHRFYGTPSALRALVDAAHGRDVAVMLDVVYNHYDGWKGAPLRCFDGDCPDPSKGVWFFRDPAYRDTPWGPRLDFAGKQVAAHVVDATESFVREYRVDGYRWDSVSNIRALDGKGTVPGGRELLARANEATRKLLPGALVVAEDLKGDANVTAKVSAGGLGFTAQWDAGFRWALADVLIPYDDAGRDLGRVREALYGRYNGDPFQRVIWTEDHDTVGNGGARLPTRIDPATPTSFAARRRSMLAAGVLFTAPGIPMLFQGQEMLAQGTFASTPDPLDWSLADKNAGIVAYYKDLVALRRDKAGTTRGLLGANVDVYHQNDGAKVLIWRRWDKGGDDVVVVANFQNKAFSVYELGLPAAGPWRVRLTSDDARYGADFGTKTPPADVVTKAVARDGLPFTGAVSLPPYAILILSRA